MKKILMMAAMVSMLASCGGNGAKKAEAPAEDDANTIVLFDGTSLDGWRVTVRTMYLLVGLSRTAA